MVAEEFAEEDVFEREVMDNFVKMRQSAGVGQVDLGNSSKSGSYPFGAVSTRERF